MSKIYLLVPPTKTVNWDNTKRIIANNLHCFALDYVDFGIGSEASIECPGCGRTLPVPLFDLDHIRPKSRYTPSSLGTRGEDRFVLLDHTVARTTDYRAAANGGVVYISSRSIYKPDSKLMQAAVVWQNDLRNLQFVCSICNSSKNGKTWEEWGKREDQAMPISKLLRDNGLMEM